MVMERPSVESLKNWLDERLEMFNSKTEKLELLNEVAKLNIPSKVLADRIDVFYLGGIQSFFSYVKHKIMTLTPKSDKTRKELSFKDLFFNPETAKEVDRIFEENQYTKDGRWIAPGKLKKPATAYYVLKDQDPGINVIKPGKDTSQLKVFYKHYGLIAAEKNGDVTIKNLLTRPQYDITIKPEYIEFVNLFDKLKVK